jgi:hypothetical protein
MAHDLHGGERLRLRWFGDGAATRQSTGGGAAATVKCGARARVQIRESGGDERMKKKKKI